MEYPNRVSAVGITNDLGSRQTKADIIGHSKEDKLYVHDAPRGKYLNVVTSENPVAEFAVSPRVKISAFHVTAKDEITTLKLEKSKYVKGNWEIDQEISLSSFSTAKLIEFLEFLKETDVQSIATGKLELVDSLGSTGELLKKLTTLAKSNEGQEAIAEFLRNEYVEKDIINVGYRRKELGIFKLLLEDATFFERYKAQEKIQAGDEAVWQYFFKKNEWIFGYGLRYQYLSLVTDQPVYGGVSYDGKGAQKGDYLMQTEAEKKYTVLVEIKTPSTIIMRGDKYRNGAYKVGEEVLWASTQVQVNCETWSREGSQQTGAREDLENQQDVFTYCPKGMLIIGHTQQLDNRDKRNSFEAFRSNQNNPRILTFDELYERARFIVEHNSKN